MEQLKISYEIINGYVRGWHPVTDEQPPLFNNEFALTANTKEELDEKLIHFNDNYFDYREGGEGLIYDANNKGVEKIAQKKLDKIQLGKYLKWFEWYDQQVCQYIRASDLKKSWTAKDDDYIYSDIEALHMRAELIASYIVALRLNLKEE